MIISNIKLNIDVGYHGEEVEGDWYVKINIPKKDNWQDTQKEAEQIKSQIIRDEKLRNEIQSWYESVKKIRNQDCRKYKHNDDSRYCDCEYCSIDSKLLSILEKKEIKN